MVNQELFLFRESLMTKRYFCLAYIIEVDINSTTFFQKLLTHDECQALFTTGG